MELGIVNIAVELNLKLPDNVSKGQEVNGEREGAKDKQHRWRLERSRI